MRNIDELFAELKKSQFRSAKRLGPKDAEYLRNKGLETICRHAEELILRRLALAEPRNDGKQTPWRGHPVFVAQHATATCCRGCLQKWHNIPKGRELTPDETAYVVAVIKRWLAEAVD